MYWLFHTNLCPVKENNTSKTTRHVFSCPLLLYLKEEWQQLSWLSLKAAKATLLALDNGTRYVLGTQQAGVDVYYTVRSHLPRKDDAECLHNRSTQVFLHLATCTTNINLVCNSVTEWPGCFWLCGHCNYWWEWGADQLIQKKNHMTLVVI